MDIKWKDSKLAKKFFIIGLITYAVYSIVVFFVIYFGIPVIYNEYKKIDLTNKVNKLIDASETLADFEYNVALFQRETNVMVSYEYDGNRYECDFKENGCRIRKFITGNDNFYNELNDRHDFISLSKNIKLNNNDIKITFLAPLSSTKEVQNILVWFLPIFGLLTMIMSLISAYIISTRFSRGIIKINEDANKITNLDFNIEKSVTSDDELGELSSSLVLLASTLENTLNDLQVANDELNDDITREREKEQERRSYIASLSHDLKTPLTAIKGQLEGMLYNVGKYQDHPTYLRKNLELVSQMEMMIQSIIISSKLDDYDLSLNLQESSISKVIYEILTEMEYLLDENGLRIEEEYLNDNFKIDVNLFSKAISNLIGNAIQYADKNSIIKIKSENNKLIISNKVSDFDESALVNDKIFKPFYRQDKSRNKQGSGLGLYIVKRICDLHGVKINVTYQNDEFLVELVF